MQKLRGASHSAAVQEGEGKTTLHSAILTQLEWTSRECQPQSDDHPASDDIRRQAGTTDAFTVEPVTTCSQANYDDEDRAPTRMLPE